jgi:transcriptional regulator with XRE-family HTH domain
MRKTLTSGRQGSAMSAYCRTNDIRLYRHKRHFRIKDVAKLIGITSSAHVAHWEKGRKRPSLVNCLKLAAVLKTTPDVLFSDLFKQIRTEIYQRKVKFNLFEKYD